MRGRGAIENPWEIIHEREGGSQSLDHVMSFWSTMPTCAVAIITETGKLH